MANRKLQGEIERVLKKVDEGVGVFEQIWDKVYSATTTAQKEKYEGDLKKEIKKLQRLRDQIKTWQGDSSIKDKTKLDANRKLIEEKMEKFKICEKETKTKAFSKEGLAQDRTDPKQKAKADVGDWVREAISSLKEQSDEFEAEIETLNSGKRKKRGDEPPRVTDLKEHMLRHEHHVEMLERVLRAVYNDAVTPEEASELKESVDYYIESNQDPDFYEDDEMYDNLNLEAAPATALASKKGGAANEDGDADADAGAEDSAAGGSSSNTSSAATSKRGGGASPRTSKGRAASSPAINGKFPPAPSSAVRSASPKSSRGDDRSPTLPSSSSPVRSNSNGAAGTAKDSLSPRQSAAPLMSSIVKGTVGRAAMSAGITGSDVPGARTGLHAAAKPGSEESGGVRTTTGPGDQPMRGQDTDDGAIAPSSGLTFADGSANNVLSNNEARNASDSSTLNTFGLGTSSAKFGGTKPLPGMDAPLSALEAALGFMPEPAAVPRGPAAGPGNGAVGGGTSGAGNGIPFAPRNPAATPPSFPTVPAPVFDNRQIFEKFDPDTLFFIFYYQQGTYQQYLAARELKRQGWRFHKKYLTWFQRHDEPKISTDEFETGTFIYFDYANVVVHGQGTGWCQRIKSEFVFEYRFLEDELQ